MRRSTPPPGRPFIGDETGATMMEYALLASLASVVVLIALLAFFRT